MRGKTLFMFLTGSFVILVFAFQNCKPEGLDNLKGTETGDPSVRLEFSAFERPSAMNWVIPKAMADDLFVSMCIHQIRLKKSNGQSEAENKNISVGWLELDPAGTHITDLDISPGEYRRFDIMVRGDCESPNSLEIQNLQGSFSSDKPQIFRFEGNIEIGLNESGQVILDISSFIDFFRQVESDSELNSGLKNISGSF